MRFFAVATTFLAAASATALPKRNWHWGYKNQCLSQDQANDIVGKFITILNHPDVPAANATAQALLSDKFQEISDSILSLEGQPLGGDTFPGKEDYINGVLNAPPVEGINTIEILVAGCTKVLWYWNFKGIGSGEYEVKGFNLFSISSAGQIDEVNLEFNSIAWGLDTGYQVIFPPGGGPPS